MFLRASPRDLFTWWVLGIVRKFNHRRKQDFLATKVLQETLNPLLRRFYYQFVFHLQYLETSFSDPVIMDLRTTQFSLLRFIFRITCPLLIHSCHFRNIVKVSPKSISVSSIESNDEINKLTLFWYSIFWCQEPTVYWETSRSDTDRSRISETDKIIISWHWWELCLQMVLFFCPVYLNLPTQKKFQISRISVPIRFKTYFYGEIVGKNQFCTVSAPKGFQFLLSSHSDVL